MNDRVRLLIKSKYGLVHVPSAHKVQRWLEETRGRMAAGEPPEQAGRSGAECVFPYEFKPYNIHGAAPVKDILDAAGA
ncbi:MAG: hypothetical protein ACLFM5_01875 [Spirochaetaceae bacterium]